MSVQLIVYPQNYEGQYNAFSTSPTEFLVNAHYFNNLSNSNSYDSSSGGDPTVDVLTNAPPTIVNTWYRFRSTLLGTPALPTNTSGAVVFNSIAATSYSGIYQRLSNLSIGQSYTATLNVSATSSGSLIVGFYDGANPVSNQTSLASVSTISFNFTATSSSNTFVVSYYNTVATNVTISDISIQPTGTTPSGADNVLEDGQVICDLYEDEDIPLSLSVDDFKNVAEKVQSYSKAFKLPATKRNNRIFDDMFEITRTAQGNTAFNPYNKTECVLKQDGFILFKGYLKMLDINDKDGEISYNVNLYSEVVALADILKDRTFIDLDFTELTHDYNVTQVQNSWNDSITGITYTYPSTSGYRSAYDTVKYPFIDWQHQYIVESPTEIVLSPLESTFRPFIQIKYLINRIFQETPFTWESAFFDTTDFGKLYMDFNWGGNTMPTPENDYNGSWDYSASTGSNVGTGSFKELRILSENATGGVPGSTMPPNYDDTTYTITATTNNEIYNIVYSFQLEATVGSVIADCRWIKNEGLTSEEIIDPLSFPTYLGTFQTILQTGDTLKAQFKATSDIRQSQVFPSMVIIVQSSISINSAILNALRGEIGQWDFLKGIMTMFNLVSLPDEDNPNNIKFEPYGDIFIQNTNSGDEDDMTLASRSIQHDWTERIDVAEMKLTPLTDLNKNTIFKFVEDDDDYPFTYYKKTVGHLYGSKVFDASTASNGLATVLEGEEEIIAEPFAATLSDTLMSQYPDIVVPKIYAMSDDESEAFDNSPRILYNNGIKSTGVNCYVHAQNGSGAVYLTNFLQFSHLTTIPTEVSNPPVDTDTNDFNFGECQLLNGLGVSTPRNLFNLYWLPYYKELYNPDTRTMSIKVNLSPSIINTFKFNDTVLIKNREFRVNKIDYKPNDLATVEFILIP